MVTVKSITIKNNIYVKMGYDQMDEIIPYNLSMQISYRMESKMSIQVT